MKAINLGGGKEEGYEIRGGVFGVQGKVSNTPFWPSFGHPKRKSF